MSSQRSNNNLSNGTFGPNYAGTNSQGNHWVHRGPSLADGGSFRYTNADGSLYYRNDNGSTLKVMISWYILHLMQIPGHFIKPTFYD
ncbi:29450_t:CDS:2 [Gigaspora margarita]|uniref:29450_t:CDS:1 n=1 Tax=Gigaspora margarita TaxID=4874 RepID=A0ABM8VZT2_GIGMA|nr:29450_t:CDS:2 [Gigaspora margarita]